MKTAAVFIIGLAVAIGVLEAIKATEYRKYAWLYIAIILMGMAVYNRNGLLSFAADIQTKMKGG
jgi:hypothetical protein